jgi:D-alanyl-D-alanine carboxypeptidase
MSIAGRSTPQIRAAWQALGLERRSFAHRALRFYPEARTLALAGLGTDRRDKVLTPAAARAWQHMQQAAAADGVTLLLISAFRSVAYQVELARNKLARGETLEAIFQAIAPPGCSEHHTGRAVDIGTPGCPPVEEAFEDTEAYRWLQQHASRYGFSLSFPRNNPQGYVYEPWHWCHGPQGAAPG